MSQKESLKIISIKSWKKEKEGAINVGSAAKHADFSIKKLTSAEFMKIARFSATKNSLLTGSIKESGMSKTADIAFPASQKIYK